MKHFSYCLISFLLFVSVVRAQAIDFSKLSLGIGANYFNTSGDMKKHWGDFLAGSIKIKYELKNDFNLQTGFSVSSIKANSNNSYMPDLVYVNLFGGIGYKLPIVKKTISINFGLVNDIFSFSEREAEQISENDIEQEVGYYIGAEISLLENALHKNSSFAIDFRYSQIFSEPEQIKFINFGIVYYFL
jgi:hypothetical protein